MTDNPITAPQWMDVAKDPRGGWSTFAAHEGNSTRYVPEGLLSEKDAEIARLRSVIEDIAQQEANYLHNGNRNDIVAVFAVDLARAALSPTTDSEEEA